MKTFILDTNVLLHDPGSLYNFEEKDIIIPIVVFEEIDKFKKELGDIGRNARDVMRSIDALRSKGSLRDGVSLGEGKGILLIVSDDIKCDFAGLGTSADNYILGITQKLLKNGCPHITLVTKDINLRLKADAFGIPAEDYLSDKVAEQQLSLVREIEADVIDAIYSLGSLNAETSGIDADFSENNCYVLKGSSKKSALVRCVKGSLKIDSQRQVSGIKPRSAEQKFLVDMLIDPAIDMVVCAGVAGSGKTLLSIACGLEMTVQGAYDKVLITKAIHPAGADIGYVKGDKREKMREWLAPFYDNLEFIGKQSKKQTLDDDPANNQMIEVDALTYIRGRSLMNRFVIIDEIQNLPHRMIKTIVSKLSDTSKLVLLGDLQQIDNAFLDEQNNGLAYVMARMQGFANVGVLNLVKSERNRLAALAIQRL